MLIRSAYSYGSWFWQNLILRRAALFQCFLYLTHRCNLRCLYCNFPFLKTLELTTSQWTDVLDQLAGLGCRRVTFLGGEPLLRPDLPDLLSYARRRGISCVVSTNGLLVPERIKALRPLQTLVISLDAAGPANDEVRGKGVYDAVKAAIGAARQAKIPLKINAVLSARTAPELDNLLRFVDDRDLGLTINVVRSGDSNLWREAGTIKAEDQEIRRLLLDIAARAKRNRRILLSPSSFRYASRWRNYSDDRYEAGELDSTDLLLTKGPKCRAGRSYFSIAPDGTASPCVTTKAKISGGNVVKDGVEACWRALHEHRCLVCFSPCLVELNFLFSFNLRVLAGFARRHLGRFG